MDQNVIELERFVAIKELPTFGKDVTILPPPPKGFAYHVIDWGIKGVKYKLVRVESND